MTADAAEAIKTIVSSSPLPEGGLRISVKPVSEQESALELALAEGPAESDSVVEEEGSRLFVEDTAAVYLEDKVLDAQAEAEGVRFSIEEQGQGPAEA